MATHTLVTMQVEAEGNTDSRPLPGFTPRKGKGLPIFGKSKSDPPVRKVRLFLSLLLQASWDPTVIPITISRCCSTCA